ncbi:MAG: tetratricopeptide repeat protein [Tepidisphaeraceae bacterium]|jgi:predicted O-linked N-acetylglucosamine transferase (SPINDLY family)
MSQAPHQVLQEHLQAGRFAEAAEICHALLAEQPDHADALHFLGLCEYQLGHLQKALELLRQAIKSEPTRAEFHGNLGLFLANAGQTEPAIESLRKALQLNPDYPQARHNLADALRKTGSLTEAIAEYRKAAALQPHAPQTHNNLGDALLAAGELDAAVASFRQASLLLPNSPEILFNLGSALATAGSPALAIPILQRALDLQPADVNTQNNLANALVAAGRPTEAVPLLRWSVASRPGDANLLLNLANALRACGKIDEPIDLFKQALAARPNWPQALNNLGSALVERGQISEGIESFRSALQADPSLAAADSNLVYYLHFHPDYQELAIHRELTRWNNQHARPLKAQFHPHENPRDPHRRLRIGYVSPDFYAQAEAHFVVPLLEHHDHDQFEIFAYASVRHPDAITARLRAACDVWQDVLPETDHQLAERIRRDRIDILVDLTMHMRDNRLLTFAQKPAPVQATWLAYPGGAGLETIDYRFTDPYLDPTDPSPPVYSEKSVRLPSTWACYDPLIDLPPSPNRAPPCFGSLNNPAKLNNQTLRLWSDVLKASPDWRLLLLVVSGFQREHIRRIFTEQGIDPARIEFVGRTSRAEYLRTFDRIGICLDPLPYNGITTTCDSLWMGVPVVSLAGLTAAGRAGLSILSNLDLPELVAAAPAEFVRIAADLAADPKRLTDLRAQLRARLQASPLMDYPRFARDIETAYRKMSRDWCTAK